MTMRHVFTKAAIANQDEVRNFALDGAGRLLHDAVVGSGSGGYFVFFLGQAEENYRGHSQPLRFAGLFHNLVDGEVEDSGHGADFLAYALSWADEDGIDEAFYAEASFANQVAKWSGATQSPKTSFRKSHDRTGSLLDQKSKGKSRGSSARSTRFRLDTVPLPPTGNSHVILADADSIGLSRAGPQSERSWQCDESNFGDLEADR